MSPPHSRSDASSDARLLPCGADPDELLEQVADGRGEQLDAHQRDCVHCQASVTELEIQWTPIATALASPVDVPPGLGATLTAAVLSRVKVLVKDVWYTLDVTDAGAVRIAARVVATLARDAARQIAGVRVAFGRSTEPGLAALVEKATLGHRHPHAAVGVLGRTAVIDLSLAVTDEEPVTDVARRVQQHVIATLRESVDLTSVKVNITVDDILGDH
ncbi:MAG: Asp23/Gls24 family envelope stress response protein [Jatrophihabitantaceae bacterium]